MLDFQKTTIYRQFLELGHKTLQILNKKGNAVFQKNAKQEIITGLANVTDGIHQQIADEQTKKFYQAGQNILHLIALLDIVSQNKAKTKEEIKKIQEELYLLHDQIENFPKKQKRILILTSIQGYGHLSPSKAVKDGIEALYGYDFRVEIVDFWLILNASFSKAIHLLYEGSIKHVPSVWQFIFTSTDQKWQVKLLNILHYPFVVQKLTKFFEEKNPDLIISTFPMWDYIAAQIWKKRRPEAKFISLVTDSISIHSAWAAAKSDYHIVANTETAASLKKLGINEDKIKVLGSPIDLRFLEKTDRGLFLNQLGLNTKLYTVLFLPTHANTRKTLKIMQELVSEPRDYNIIVVFGKNIKLKKKLMPYAHHKNICILGWTDELPHFINVADLVITKPGGATTMECIGAKKPMLVTQIIPGQEEGNAELIRHYKLGIILEENFGMIRKNIATIRKNKQGYEKNLAKLSRPAAALDIARFIKTII